MTIKSIERAIAAHPTAAEFFEPRPSHERTGKRVAIVGSGPAGLAAAQQLARRGHDVTVFERDNRIGGLLRYGIPDFKLEKTIVDRRLAQLEGEGVSFVVSVDVDKKRLADFDATILAIGSTTPRDLTAAGRDLAGVHFAMEYLAQHNRRVAGDAIESQVVIDAKGKHVVVLGGGDTGSDCVGTAMRQGASSVTQLELMPKPPLVRMPQNPWPEWPLVLRTSSSQEEAAYQSGSDIRDFAVSTRSVLGDERGHVRAIEATRVSFAGGKIVAQDDSKFEIPCDLVLLAMGFVGPERKGLVADLGLALDARGNVATNASGATNVDRIFSAGDASRGQSLVVWAIADGRRVADGVDSYLRRAIRRAG